MLQRLFCLALGILIAQAFYVPRNDVAASAAENTSDKRVGSCHIEEFGAYNALRDISQKAHVVIGLEAVQPDKDTTFVLDFPGGTVADLLNMFTSQSPDYKWEEADEGIIHVFRTYAHVSLTDVVMAYPETRNRTRREIWEDIAKRPEVSAWMASTHCSRGELFDGNEFRGRNNPISIAPRSLTLEQLLDEVAVKSGVNYWAILRSPSSNPCQVHIILW